MRAARRGAALIVITAVIAVIAATVLVACTGPPHRVAPTSATSSSARPSVPEQSAPPAPTSLPTYRQYPVPSSVANDPAKLTQVKIVSCQVSAGVGATATGAVHNTGSRPATYDITVFSPATARPRSTTRRRR